MIDLLEMFAGLALGVLILFGVALIAVRAGDRPMRTRDSRFDYTPPPAGSTGRASDGWDGGDSGGGHSGH